MANAEYMDPKYIVVEIRQNFDNTISNQVTSFDADNRKAAEAKYFTQCAAARVSDKAIYSVALMSTELVEIKREVFLNPKPEPETEQEGA